MTKTVGSLVALKDALEVDGSYMFKVADFGEEPFEVAVFPRQITDLLQTLQKALLERATASGTQVSLPIVTASHVDLLHSPTGSGVALRVDIPQTGSLAVHLSGDTLHHLKSAVDRALRWTPPPGQAQN